MFHKSAWALGVAGVVIVGGVGTLLVVHHHATDKTITTAKPPIFHPYAKTPPTPVPTSPAQVQTTKAPTNAKSSRTVPVLWAKFAMLNRDHLSRLATLENDVLPWLHMSVANDTTVSLRDFNKPEVLSQYHVPPLPTSLAAAGVASKTLPTNGAILGMNPTLSAAWQAETVHGPAVDHLSAAQLAQAVTVATRYLLDIDGNGNSGVYLENPLSTAVSDAWAASLTSPTAAVSAFTGAQGLFAQRQYVYRDWATMQGVTIGISAPDAVPAGHVVTTLIIKNILVNLIMGSVDQGHEIIGLYRLPPMKVAVDLIQDAGQTRWYVSAASSGETGNPSQVLWTGPAVS